MTETAPSLDGFTTRMPAADPTLADLLTATFRAAGGTVACSGTNHDDRGRTGTCGACGRDVVARDKGGVYDLRRRVTAGGRDRTDYACYRPAHVCDPAARHRHRRAVLDALAAGELQVGFPVRAHKGRKVPVGLTGTIIWIGEDDHGPRLGIRPTVGGDVAWTAADNVAVRVGPALAADLDAHRAVRAAERAELAAERARDARLDAVRTVLGRVIDAAPREGLLGISRALTGQRVHLLSARAHDGADAPVVAQGAVLDEMHTIGLGHIVRIALDEPGPGGNATAALALSLYGELWRLADEAAAEALDT